MSTDRTCDTCAHSVRQFKAEAPWYRQCRRPESVERHGWKLMPAESVATLPSYPCGPERRLWERRA